MQRAPQSLGSRSKLAVLGLLALLASSLSAQGPIGDPPPSVTPLPRRHTQVTLTSGNGVPQVFDVPGGTLPAIRVGTTAGGAAPVNVTVAWPNFRTAPPAALEVECVSGGFIATTAGDRTAAVLGLSEDGTGFFVFRAPVSRGLHRVVLRAQGHEVVLNFVVAHPGEPPLRGESGSLLSTSVQPLSRSRK